MPSKYPIAAMNQLTPEKRAQVINCLVEGNSIRSTERMCDVHLPPEFTQILLHAAEPHGGVPGNDANAAEFREDVDQFFRKPVAEVGVIWIGAEIRERQHDNTMNA